MNKDKPTILILGIDGMVGHTLFKYFFNCTDFQVLGTSRKKTSKIIFDLDYDKNANKLNNIFGKNKIDFVINSIAKLKDTKNTDYKINYKLPLDLEKLADKFNFKLIHISTDDVFPYLSNIVNEKSTPLPANNYGKSKLKGETKSINSINVRTSFLGFNNNGKGLLEMLTNNINKNINGYANQTWSGCTTLQFAKFCNYLVSQNNFNKTRKVNNIIHFTPLGPISKYNILETASEIFKLNSNIKKQNAEITITRKLESIYLSKPFLSKFSTDVDKDLLELYKFEEK